MRPEVVTLLAKAFSRMAKDMRPDLMPGEYQVDEVVTFHALGGMNVGDDYPQHIANKAKPWKLLKAALDKLNGVTIESLVRESEQVDSKGEKELKAAVEKAAARLKAKTLTHCKGKVTFRAPLATQVDMTWTKKTA
jgi:hypothetical protein